MIIAAKEESDRNDHPLGEQDYSWMSRVDELEQMLSFVEDTQLPEQLGDPAEFFARSLSLVSGRERQHELMVVPGRLPGCRR